MLGGQFLKEANEKLILAVACFMCQPNWFADCSFNKEYFNSLDESIFIVLFSKNQGVAFFITRRIYSIVLLYILIEDRAWQISKEMTTAYLWKCSGIIHEEVYNFYSLKVLCFFFKIILVICHALYFQSSMWFASWAECRSKMSHCLFLCSLLISKIAQSFCKDRICL